MTLNINLTPELETLVRNKVASGRYGSASEVVRDALRLMESRDQEYAAKLQWLRQAVQEGIDSGDAGVLDMNEIKRKGRERLAQLKKQKR